MKRSEKKYVSVKNFILKGIREGNYPPGTKIPTEDAIMSALGYSRSPVRHAISLLEQEGYVYKIHGSGSFVKQAVEEEPINIYALLYPDSRGIEKDFIHGMRQAVNHSRIRDLHLILQKPGRTNAEVIEILQSIPSDRKAGIIIIPFVHQDRANNRLLAANLRKLETKNLVVVQLDRCAPGYEGSCVMSDHRRGAYEMIRRLVELRHRKIAVFLEHSEHSSIRQRLQGVKECLTTEGIPFPQTNLLDIPVAETPRYEERIVDLVRTDKVTAVFCLECEIALAVQQVFQTHNVKIPEDVSLCSFDDHCYTGHQQGFLTAVVQPLEELGYFSVDLILRELEKPSTQPIKMVMEPTIVERRSVAAI
jgi:GntR family transcriptional regulator of arabinose operon